jgi:hypothetical protein
MIILGRGGKTFRGTEIKGTRTEILMETDSGIRKTRTGISMETDSRRRRIRGGALITIGSETTTAERDLIGTYLSIKDIMVRKGMMTDRGGLVIQKTSRFIIG